MEKSTVLNMVNDIKEKQKEVSAIIEELQSCSDIKIFEYRTANNELFVYKGIEVLADICGGELLFTPFNYVDSPSIGDVYFYYDDMKIFQVVTAEEKDALLGGDAA